MLMKKVLSVVLTLMMVFSVFTTASALTVKDNVNSFFGTPTDPFLAFTEMPINIKAFKNSVEYPGAISEQLVSGGVGVDFEATLVMQQLRDFFDGSEFIGTVLAGDNLAKDEFDRAIVATDITVTVNHPGVTVEEAANAGGLISDNNGTFEQVSRTVNPDEVVVKYKNKDSLTVAALMTNKDTYLADLTFELNDAAKYTTEGQHTLKITMSARTTITFDNQTQADTSDDFKLYINYAGENTYQANIYSPSTGGGGVSKHSLTYETDGGSSVDKETYTRNATVKLTKVPKKEGYIFEGWYLDKELTQRVTEVKMTKNTTVYAGWVVDNGLAGSGYDTPEILNGTDHFAYVVGYPDGTVRPNDNITRAEVTTIFFRLLKEAEREKALTNSNSFSDVNEDDWYNTAVSTMANIGIINGRTEDSFVPNAFITRAEFAAICARFVEPDFEAANKFADVSGHWAEKEIYEAAEYGWIRGYEDNTFKPDQFITRAEAMTMINRVLNRVPETSEDLHHAMKIWSDNSDESTWYYIPVQEATNGHDYDKKNHIYEKFTELREAIDWTKYE
jgi:uncharacterized repeat protein (TIGR02543 family)